MRFAFNDEQEELRRTVRKLLVERAPSAEVRRAARDPRGYDRELWGSMTEIGIPSLLIPEEYGGAGFGFVELAAALEETGHGPLPSPLLPSTVLASAALLAGAEEDAKQDLLPELAAGGVLAALAGADPSSGESSCTGAVEPTGDPGLQARSSGAHWTIEGIDPTVLGGHTADMLVVVAETDAGPTLFAVPSDAPGLSVEPLTTMDQTRTFSRVEFRKAVGRRIGAPGTASQPVGHAIRLAQAAIALECVGGAQQCLGLAVEHARTRRQFGRPIGSFQAVQHQLADALLRVESARSAAWYAAWCADFAPDQFPTYAALAKAYCTEAYLEVAGTCIQVHGGIGITWEHDAHLHLKRAQGSQAYLGSPSAQRRWLAAQTGLTPTAKSAAVAS